MAGLAASTSVGRALARRGGGRTGPSPPGDGPSVEVIPMIASASPSYPLTPDDPLHAAFLPLLPRIELHARIFFRHLKCPHQKQDMVAETVALSWKWFLRAAAKGKDVHQFVGTLAAYAARHVKSGRKLCTQERA